MDCSSCGKTSDKLESYVSPYQPSILELCPACAEKWTSEFEARTCSEVQAELQEMLAQRYSSRRAEIDGVLASVADGKGAEQQAIEAATAIRHFLMTGEED